MENPKFCDSDDLYNYSSLSFQVGEMCKVYGWGLKKSKGSYEFKVQQIKVPSRMSKGYQWGCATTAENIKYHRPIIKSLLEKKTICAGSTGFSLCQVCL